MMVSQYYIGVLTEINLTSEIIIVKNIYMY